MTIALQTTEPAATMKVYSIDIQLCATAYIKAANKVEALAMAKKLAYSSPRIMDADGDVEVCGLAYNDQDLPDISLSPAMTIRGIWPGSAVESAE